MTRSRTVSSPISAGSTWHRRFSTTSRSCASPSTTSRPGTSPTGAAPEPHLTRSGSMTASSSSTTSRASTAAPSRACSIATARTARCSTTFAIGTSHGATSSASRAWVRFRCIYNSFRNGKRITDAHRLVYRRRDDLALHFPDPFETSDPRRSYYRWFELHGPTERLRPLVKLLKKSAPGRRCGWPARPARRGGAGRSRHEGYRIR